MVKILLRSGKLDDFQAVGGSGQSVFDSAQQVRETLRLRHQHAVAECLAVPQLNDEGDRVDWYAPITGSVMSWKAAPAVERERALRYLEGIQESTRQLAKKCLQSGKTTQQLFGSLLEKTLQFPGENHLFLVDGKPVISFWGFVNLNESAREDIFACLREREREPEPEPEPIVEPLLEEEEDDAPVYHFTTSKPSAPRPEPVAEPEPAGEPEPEPPVSTPVLVEPTPEPAAVVAPAPRRSHWRWTLPLAAAVVAAVAIPLWLPAAQEPALAQAPVVVAPVMPALTNALPLQRASHTEAPPKAPDVVLTPIAKDAMVMESDQMRAGTTRFLNGNWRAVLTMKDAPSLRYQIKDNKGTARVVHGNNIICKATIFSGLHQNGELRIKSRGTALCADGSRFPMPEITCKAGTNNVADCTARYGADAVVPLTFKKIGS